MARGTEYVNTRLATFFHPPVNGRQTKPLNPFTAFQFQLKCNLKKMIWYLAPVDLKLAQELLYLLQKWFFPTIWKFEFGLLLAKWRWEQTTIQRGAPWFMGYNLKQRFHEYNATWFSTLWQNSALFFVFHLFPRYPREILCTPETLAIVNNNSKVKCNWLLPGFSDIGN